MERIHEDDTHIREWVRNVFTKAERVLFYPDRFDDFDGEYVINGKFRYIELKNRHFNHDKYKTTIIEKSKWLRMKEKGNCSLCILFDDGILFYTPKDCFKNVIGNHVYVCPHQYDVDNNKWEDKDKECVKFLIDMNCFHTYDKFDSIPNREKIKSKYYD